MIHELWAISDPIWLRWDSSFLYVVHRWSPLITTHALGYISVSFTQVHELLKSRCCNNWKEHCVHYFRYNDHLTFSSTYCIIDHLWLYIPFFSMPQYMKLTRRCFLVFSTFFFCCFFESIFNCLSSCWKYHFWWSTSILIA